MARQETFSSRWSLILAAIGLVVGTGNIWRFPRIVAKNGGGAFLIAWFVFLFLWSIPLLIAEFAIGKTTRRGTIGAITKLIGPRFSWIGGFIGFCTVAIMFYYSVVMGWCLRFFVSSLSGSLFKTSADVFWNSFITSSWQPIFFHAIAISLGAVIVLRGITKGVERANNILIPLLIIMLIVAAVRALSLPGAVDGLNFFFSPDWKVLTNHRVWLEALSQSAWSTGAGWGLILTYAVYMRQKEDIVLNSFLAGLGNNSASLLVGLAIFPAVFALAPQLGVQPREVMQVTGPASTGMAFIWMPRLFAQMPGAKFFTSIFFLSLTIAALTSLIAMIELAVRNLIDLGFKRSRALVFVWLAGFFLGVPSASKMAFFENQDWVWGIGLLVSGFFIAFTVIKYNPRKFRDKCINTEYNDIKIGVWYEWIIRFLIPAEFVILLGWWFYQAIAYYEPHAWWQPFRTFSVGTCLFQWGAVILLFIILNGQIAKKLDHSDRVQNEA
ncbi:MAG: sodium-dependent transporter [Calditrichaeota bacterium]|nr:sodium-dependent transporter [Calditrichota bacterium]